MYKKALAWDLGIPKISGRRPRIVVQRTGLGPTVLSWSSLELPWGDQTHQTDDVDYLLWHLMTWLYRINRDFKKQALPHWLYKIWEAPWEYHSPRVDSEDYKKMMVPTPNNWYSWWQMFMVCGKTLETNTMWDGFWLIFPWNRVPTSWLWTKKHWSRTSPYFFPHAWAKTWLLIPHWQILCCKHIVILSLTKSTQNCLHAESRPERLLLHPSTPLQLRGCFAAIDVREEGHIMPQWSQNTCWIMLRAYY